MEKSSSVKTPGDKKDADKRLGRIETALSALSRPGSANLSPPWSPSPRTPTDLAFFIIMSETGAAASLDRIGCGRFAVAMFLIAGLGWISDGAEAAVLSYMLPVLKARFAATEAMLGPITSLLAGAQALGAAFWGSLADRAGRRKAFLCSVGLTAVFGLASAWAWSLPSSTARMEV